LIRWKLSSDLDIEIDFRTFCQQHRSLKLDSWHFDDKRVGVLSYVSNEKCKNCPTLTLSSLCIERCSPRIS